jgi:hypothetical protein
MASDQNLHKYTYLAKKDKERQAAQAVNTIK